jgi:hypothetical protein
VSAPGGAESWIPQAVPLLSVTYVNAFRERAAGSDGLDGRERPHASGHP